MSDYSEDLRTRIVSAVGGGMSKAQAARTFSVSLSSVKRYVEKAHRGESLAPKKRPGSAPKLDDRAMKLLEEDLKERPFATLQERCDYVEAITGLSVSRSTMCRAIARIGPTRKKGGELPRNATSSSGRPGG
jgi:transposase